MKKTIISLSAVLSFFLFGAVTCEDPEPFVNVKTIETQVYNNIKAHREANGVTGNFVQQFVMVQEAQLHSAVLTFGDGSLDTTGLAAHWTTIHDKIGGYNDVVLMQSTTAITAEDIVAPWKADSASNAILLEDVTQCGVGIEYDANSLAYVTVLMMKVDSK